VTDAESQWINLASLILGQNGIWGDLLAVTDEGVQRIGDFLRLYKQVRDDITQATLLRSGQVGGSPEVYEKVYTNGRGAISLFASASGTYTYVTRAANLSPNFWHNDGVSVEFDQFGRCAHNGSVCEAERKRCYSAYNRDADNRL
jgi:alpha-galactosidase